MANLFAQISFCALVILVNIDAVHAKGAQPFVPGTAPAAGTQAAEPDAAAQQALRETQDLLLDQSKRIKALESDPKARDLDAKIKSQLGDQSEGAYQISSQIMEKLIAETGGDIHKLKDIVERLQANPRLIESYLSTADRQKIREMAGKLETQKGNAPVSPGR